MEISDIVAIIRDVIVAGAAVATVCIANKGLKSWQAELKGRTSFEAARTLMIAVHRLRDEIRYCRSPYVPPGELPEGYDPLDKSPEYKGKALAYVYTNRWKPVMEAMESFDSALLEAEALWGEKVKLAGFELRKCVRQLSASIENLIHNEYSGDEDFRQDFEYRKKVKSDVYMYTSEEDKLGRKIAKAVARIENEIKPHLAGS